MGGPLCWELRLQRRRISRHIGAATEVQWDFVKSNIATSALQYLRLLRLYGWLQLSFVPFYLQSMKCS